MTRDIPSHPVSRRRRQRAGVAAATTLASLLSFAGIAQAKDDALRARCDLDLADNEAAIQRRDVGDSNGARAILNRVIARRPDSFRATYVMGTVALQTPTAAGQEEGLKLLLKALSMFRVQSQACAKEFGWYSIYNTVGVHYYKQKDYSKAIYYYKRGYDYIDFMVPNTKQNLLNNLGLYYFAQGDMANARKYYEKASDAGYAKARRHLAAIETIETAQTKAAR